MDHFDNNDQDAIKHLLNEDKVNNYDKMIMENSKRKNNRSISIVTLIILSLVFGLIGGALSYFVLPLLEVEDIEEQTPNNILIQTNNVPLDAAAAVAEKVMPSVVGISTEIVYSDFFGKRRGEGVGTGVIVDKNGYILTNSHVVNNGDMTDITVLLHDGRELAGELLWNDSVIDLAIIKIDAQNLNSAELADSDNLKVGQYAVAIGNPLGFQFERTVTAGIISGLNRTIPISNYESIEGLIQTDASINPGNSGGPLLNQKGQVIGINTAKIQSGEGLGFAIPINIAQPIVNEFKEKGEFSKAVIGIRGVDVEQYLQTFDVDLGVEEGVYIYQIFTDSAAAKAGLKEGDIITSIDGKEITNMSQLVSKLYQYRPGDTINIMIVRDKRSQEVSITLSAAIDI